MATSYLEPILLTYSIFMMGAISPGPDAIVLLKTAISNGRKKAYFVALGLGVSVFLITQYTLFGMGYVFEKVPWLIYVIQYGGSLFLLYLGIQSLRASGSFDVQGGKKSDLKPAMAFRNGLMTNFLNPFAILYIISLMAAQIPPEMPGLYKITFGVVLGLSYGIWNSVLSFIPTNRYLGAFFNKYNGIFSKISGVLLIYIAISNALKVI
tara:strand:- start:4660 stop:5286 length:627 start_codon:yes stop_codon:yes gene_type:complete